jgi:hypothetical protein
MAGTTSTEANDTPIAGQKTGITTTPVALAANVGCRGVLLQADPANTTNVLVGNASGQFFVLTPGSQPNQEWLVSNLNLIWAKMASGTGTVNWIGRA